MAARRVPVRRLARAVLVLAALLGAVFAVVSQRAAVGHALTQLNPGVVVLAGVSVVAATVCSMLAWRALLADLGSPLPLLPAARVFYLGQLGKYIPGSVWSVVGQVELARDLKVPARRSTAAALLTIAVSLGTGLALAAGTLPFVTPQAVSRYGWAFAFVPVIAVGLHPRVLNPVLRVGFRLIRRPELAEPLTLRGIGIAAGWSLLAWLGFGIQAALLVRDLGGRGGASILGAIGAFALAWSVGFLVLIAPAGAGVREAVLTLALAPALPTAAALLVAVVSRVLLTASDLLLAGAAILAERRRSGRPAAAAESPEAARSPEEPGSPQSPDAVADGGTGGQPVGRPR